MAATTPANGSDTPITVESLATVFGASVGAIVIVQAIKVFRTDLSDVRARQIALIAGLVIVVLATYFVNSGLDAPHLLLSVIVGLQAGLAASKSADIFKAGLNHLVTPRP